MSDSLMTPPDLIAGVVEVYGRPALDPCWHPRSPVDPIKAICLTETGRPTDIIGDGLSFDWKELVPPTGYIWLNPPYSRGQVAKWLRKALDSERDFFALLRFDPTTKWWNLVKETSLAGCGAAIGFFNHRLKYLRTDGGKQVKANFVSALVHHKHEAPGSGRFYRLPPSLGVTWIN